jgi:hypothetical protein
MKYPILLTLLASTLFASENYKACGANEKEARIALAGSIRSVVKSESSSNAQSSQSGFWSSFDKTVAQSSSVKSDVLLVDVHITHEEDQICAETSKIALKKYAETLAKKASRYNTNTLPKEQIAKADLLDSWLADIENSNNLLSLFPDLSNQYQTMITDKRTSFRHIRSLLHTQYAKFIVIGDERARIEIGNKSFFPNENIYLPVGEYSYQVMPNDANKEHIITGTFELESHESQTIEADIDAIIASEKRTAAAKQLASDTADSISETGKNIGSFITGDDETTKILQKRTKAFSKRSKHVELIYGLPKASNNFKSLESLKRYEINLLKNHQWLVYGLGAVYGKGDKSYEAEFNAHLRLQIVSIGNDTPFHISSVAIVPYIGMTVGIGYHEIYDDAQGKIITNFPRPNKNEEQEFAYRDEMVRRLGGGIDIVLSDFIALKITYDKTYSMREDTRVGFGLKLIIPE